MTRFQRTTLTIGRAYIALSGLPSQRTDRAHHLAYANQYAADLLASEA